VPPVVAVTRRVVPSVRDVLERRFDLRVHDSERPPSRDELLALAADLLTRTDAGSRPIRGLGLAATTLVQQRRDDRQLDLFTPPR